MSFDNSFTAVTGATYTASQYNTYTRDNLDALHAMIQNIYFVGIVIESIVSTNPATILGFGTWTAFGAGRVTVGINAADADFDTVEETGGEKTHSLTGDENGAHTHSYTKRAGNQNVDNGAQLAAYYAEGGATTGSSGSGTGHNNLQPYIVVYKWKRTA
jgi:hypothetical protein